jgi:pyruvate,water dikinase
MPFIRFFDEISNKDVTVVGGKNASLGEMYCNLTAQGIRVPFGFATTAHAYRTFINETGTKPTIMQLLETLDPNNMDSLSTVALALRTLILTTEFPKPLAQAREPMRWCSKNGPQRSGIQRYHVHHRS